MLKKGKTPPRKKKKQKLLAEKEGKTENAA